VLCKIKALAFDFGIRRGFRHIEARLGLCQAFMGIELYGHGSAPRQFTYNDGISRMPRESDLSRFRQLGHHDQLRPIGATILDARAQTPAGGCAAGA
jgi:hypothetical protein